MVEHFKDLWSDFLVILVLIGIFTTILLCIAGSAWLSLILPWLIGLSIAVFVFTLIITLPLSAYKEARHFCFLCMVLASFIFILLIYLSGFLIVYYMLGIFGVIIGVFFVGIGIIPMAIIILIINGAWKILLGFIFLITFSFILQGLSQYLTSKE